MTRKNVASVHCAIYSRKSSEEGLEQEFNSLHAQWEACEAYFLSQKHEGWTALPQHYDDGGISGATMNRPALQRLLDDIWSRKGNYSPPNIWSFRALISGYCGQQGLKRRLPAEFAGIDHGSDGAIALGCPL